MTHIKEPIEKYLLQQHLGLQRLVLADTYGLTELREASLKSTIEDTICWGDGVFKAWFKYLETTTKVDVLQPKVESADIGFGSIRDFATGKAFAYIRTEACPLGEYSENPHSLGTERKCWKCKDFQLEEILKIAEKNQM